VTEEVLRQRGREAGEKAKVKILENAAGREVDYNFDFLAQSKLLSYQKTAKST
jgi:hypothetical protein